VPWLKVKLGAFVYQSQKQEVMQLKNNCNW
jgi:hypothetical protein